MIFLFTASYWVARAQHAHERIQWIRDQRFRSGWNWAAGQLLRGTAPEEVSRQSEQAIMFDDVQDDPFDVGVASAVLAWRARI